MQESPHAGQPLHSAGVPLTEAGAAMVMLHGRGSSADDILSLVDQLDQGRFAYLAPQAAGSSWYPKSFRAPLAENEPWLSSALAAVGEAAGTAEQAGIPADRVLLLGFSQGACLTLEFVARGPRRYGGVAALTGALIGPDGVEREPAGRLDGTPVFLGSGDPDPHVPLARVKEAAAAFTAMGAIVTQRVYPGLGHAVNRDEIDFVRGMMEGLLEYGE
jgi:phospholipase/carboxylesterase